MTRHSYLAYVPDPFSIRMSRYLLLTDGGEFRFLEPNELSTFSGPLVTYELPALVDDLRRANCKPPVGAIDIGEALRLCVGIPRDEGGERRWNVWRQIGKHFDCKSNAQVFAEIVKSREERPSNEQLGLLMVSAATAVRELWLEVDNRLRSSGEFERFNAIEAPVQAIFSFRQHAGIQIDPIVAEHLGRKIADDKYRAYAFIAEKINSSPTGLNFWNVQKYLDRTDAAHLKHIENGGRLQDAFKIAAFTSKFAEEFLNYKEASRDEAIVRRAVGRADRIYPIFHILGTISGRILVSDPYLQQLRRAYRGLISPDPNMKLVYLDYAQFEPGIMAFASRDESLTAAYNKGDIYTALSEEVFGSARYRPLAKRMFLAFCYGMSADNIAKLVSGQAGNEVELQQYKESVERFFGSFPGLARYRTEMALELETRGFASSQCGNRRYRQDKGPLTPAERRWALNQPIQSTASLIFKEALLALAAEFGFNSIVLPIHDAVLMQFEANGDFETKVEVAQSIMQRAFTLRCPSISARVSAGSFAS